VTPGTSDGVGYTARAHTSSGTAYGEDILSSAAGAQHGTATLASSTDWYAVAATFRPTSTGDTQPPSVPAGLHTTSVSTSSVSLAWSPSTDNVGVTGYTVYRNGASLGPVSTTSFVDNTVSAGTTYTYTVDAFDAAGNHSAQSQPLQVTTPTRSPTFVQGAADSPGTRSTSTTLTLTQPVAAGDLLVGWFAQYDSTGQVHVSDSVNGAWTRASSETFTNGGGDIALYYVQNTKAAPSGLTITISASVATYLPSAVSEYSGISTSNALDQAAVGKGVGTAAASGSTAAVASGELVFGGLITGGQPLTVTPGSSQGAPFTLEAHNGSESADTAAILSAAAGTQQAQFTLARSSDWYAAVATFRPGP
jgi:chitodextrinase